METTPMPTPPTMRYITSSVSDMAIAQPIEPAVNSTADRSMVGRRPRRSLSMPATATPNIEPMRAQPTYHPCIMESRWNCSVTWSMVPDITAVS